MSEGALAHQAAKEQTAIIGLPRYAETHADETRTIIKNQTLKIIPISEYCNLLKNIEYIAKAGDRGYIQVTENLKQQAHTRDNHRLSNKRILFHQSRLLLFLPPI